MSVRLKNFGARGLVMASLAAVVLTSVPLSDASAQYYHRRGNAGAAVAGGVIGGVLGGLAAGAILSSPRPAYAAPVYGGPVYAAPVYGGPVYGEPVYEHVQTCRIVRRKIWLDDYSYTFRHTRICD